MINSLINKTEANFGNITEKLKYFDFEMDELINAKSARE